MLKKISSILFSTRLTAILFLVFATAMATATFLDASSETSPTPYTRTLIYNAWWFEAIMGLFMVNFIGNIFRYRLLRKEKWATLVFHLAFILIILGAYITRYISYEGVMNIREGATENTILSSDTYLKVFIDGDYKIDGVGQRLNVTPRKVMFSEKLDTDFEINPSYNKQEVNIRVTDFIKNAKEGLIPSDDGDAYLKIVEAGSGQRHDHFIKKGDIVDVHNVLFAFNNPTDGAINIGFKNGEYTIKTPFEGQYMRMADQQKGMVLSDSIQPLHLRSLYQMANMAFVFPEPVTKGTFGIIKADKNQPTHQDAITVEVSSNNETKIIEVLGGKGVVVAPKLAEVGGLKVYVSYGSKEYKLPFSITLNDFIADKYPGTQKSYAAFKSKVTVNLSKTKFYDYELFMNHILDEGGYRFFQSGFDPDEKGTILSVNHDFWGTWITYVGYFFLYLGLLAILFDRNTRFASLKKMLQKIKKKKSELTLLLFLIFSISGFSQEQASHSFRNNKETLDSIIKVNAVSKEHAEVFSRLLLQDNGRMKPIDTYSSELLRKISGDKTYEGLNANQVFVSMLQFPRLWLETPIIKLTRGNDSIREIIGVPKNNKYIKILDLLDEKGRNKLEPYLEEATKTNTPNQFQKDFIKTYEKSYLLNQALSGSLLKIFPLIDDSNNKWISSSEITEANYKKEDSAFVRNVLPYYFETINEARKTGDYKVPNQLLEGIANFQKKYGSKVMLSEDKINAELFYNKADIFNRMVHYFSMFGILMFVFIIIQIFNQKKGIYKIINIFKYLIWLLFIILTFGLILRWYISGHAPWTNAYESMVYVAWATVLFGLTLGRKSNLTIASTAFVASIILWAAHQSWVDPQIATLVPVLNSYWLMIHVAIIVASYGPFTLGMILAITSLLLMLLTNNKNFNKMNINIKELTIITEMALTVGLVMLTIGNFLGGQWANESWGRYWGWDPKETWALISIMIYAFVIHMRLVPGLRGRWTFNVAAILAFSSIMMTYFGVNFYLTGLHSYASGDKPITPSFVWYSVGFIFLLSGFAYLKYKKFYKK